MNKLLKVINNPRIILQHVLQFKVFRVLSDKTWLGLKYYSIFGKKIDWKNPKTFNEKLHWLKLYDRKPIYTTMVDKYAAKKYVASIIGEEYIIPTLGVWNNFDEIDFDSLPDQFVLKCTHDSGGLVICKDKSKFDMAKAKEKIEKCLEQNYYWHSREWPYKDVKPRIIAEKYMEDTNKGDLWDYKFFCFGGVARCYKVNFDKFAEPRANYFDLDGNLIKIGEIEWPPDTERNIQIPGNIEKMKELAEKLSQSQAFLRADFYDIDEKIYFGELTFYPDSGFCKYFYENNDELLGSWVRLPETIGGGMR